MDVAQATNYIALAIPIFFLLIGIELLIGKLKETKLYRFNDAVTNISCGIGQQIIGVFSKTILIIGYLYLYEHHRLFTIEHTWFNAFLLFIGVDFFYYWFHRLAHEVSFMWGSHVVHHQSEEYNLSVALRQGWIQAFFSTSFYLPLAFLGFHPVAFVVINQLQTLYQFWIHTKTIDKLPAPFEYVMNTPSHHRVHHGVNPKYIDRNHGGTLIIFDRIFGTFQAEEEEVVYGITTQPKSWNPLWLNLDYWADMFRNVKRATKWSDKIKILIKEPGWKPAELGGPIEGQPVTPQTFKKYDTTIPNGLNYYILFQYLVIMLSTTLFLFGSSKLDFLPKLAAGALILFSLVNLGGLFEAKRWVWYAEHLRLLLITLLGALLLGSVMSSIPIILLGLAFMGLSIIWLNQYRSIFTKTITSLI